MRTIHLAILDADIPARDLYDARGLYSAQFRDILTNACSRINASNEKGARHSKVKVSAWDIHGGSYPPYDILRQTTPDRLERYMTPLSTASGGHALGPVDAILITGASPGAYEIERHPWMQNLEVYIRVVFKNHPNVRILGSCFGHQIIAKVLLLDFGSSYQVDIEKCPLGREVGIYDVQLNHTFIRAFPILNRLPEGKLRVQMMHGDWVLVTRRDSDKRTMSLPHPWQNIGSTAICPIQGIYHPGRVLTVQGHFELDAFAMIKVCEEFGPRLGWSESQTALYRKQVGPDIQPRQDDAETLAEVVISFLAGIERTSVDSE